MLQLSLDRINATAPYKVQLLSSGRDVRFTTDVGARIIVGFMEDCLLNIPDTYELMLSNENGIKSKNDHKLRDTVITIVDEFFSSNANTLLYVCETADGKQAARDRRFTYWFKKYEQNTEFTMLKTAYRDEDQVDNYISVIIPNNSPHWDEVIKLHTEIRMQLLKK